MITVVLEGKIHRFNGPDANQQAQELCRKRSAEARKRPMKVLDGPKQPYLSREKRMEIILAGMPAYGDKGESLDQVADRLQLSLHTVKSILQLLQQSKSVVSLRDGRIKRFTLPEVVP